MDRLRLRLRPSFLPCSIVVKGSVSSATDDDDREWIAAAPIHHRSLGCPLPPSLPSLSPCSPGEPALCKSNRTPTLIMSASKDQRTSDGRTDGRTDGRGHCVAVTQSVCERLRDARVLHVTETVSARVHLSSSFLYSSLLTRFLTTVLHSLRTCYVVYRMSWREKRASDVTLLSCHSVGCGRR